MLDFPDLVPEDATIFTLQEWADVLEHGTLSQWEGTAYYVQNDRVCRGFPSPFRELPLGSATGVAYVNRVPIRIAA